MNTIFKVIGLTRLGIKPESTAQETDAPYHSVICVVKLKHCGIRGLANDWFQSYVRVELK